MKQHISLPKPAQQMTTGDIMRFAHKLTKSTIRQGDDYSATFGLCLKLVYAAVREGMELHSEMKAAVKKSPAPGFYAIGFLVLVGIVFVYFVTNALYASLMGSAGYTVFHLMGALLSGLIGFVEMTKPNKYEPLAGAAKFLFAR